MQMLVSGTRIIAIGNKISYGKTDPLEKTIDKWRIADEEDNTQCYWIDNGFELVENVTLPEDYEPGKYFYENGEFILNEDWKPYVSPEERIATLETMVAIHEENDAELLYQICLLQLGITEDDMQ